MDQRSILAHIASFIELDGGGIASFKALSECAVLDDFGARVALSRTACVVAAGTWAKSRCVIKNRDRNYHPRIVVFHEEVNGVELCYLKDLETGWIEGMNVLGMGIVNSALAVARDEDEKKRAKKGEPTKDGQQMREALSKKSAKEAVKYLKTKGTKMLGHTFIATPDSIRTLEQTSKHVCIEKETSRDVVLVRTNHGWNHEGAGYQKGDDHASSLARRENAQRVLEEEMSVPELAPALYNHEYRKKDHNIVRDAKMITSTQMVCDLSKKALYLYLVPGKQDFLGVCNLLGRKPKIAFNLLTYDASGKPKAVEYDSLSASEVPSE